MPAKELQARSYYRIFLMASVLDDEIAGWLAIVQEGMCVRAVRQPKFLAVKKLVSNAPENQCPKLLREFL